jgi:hypothetical protein
MYDLTLLVFELTQHFSREYKFTLGQDMKRDCMMLVRSIYRAFCDRNDLTIVISATPNNRRKINEISARKRRRHE